jgi:hypothetical protein
VVVGARVVVVVVVGAAVVVVVVGGPAHQIGSWFSVFVHHSILEVSNLTHLCII